MEQKYLEQYANAIVRIGVNLQKGDGVMVNSGTEALPLLREVVKACWQAGARHVSVNMSDDQMTLDKFTYADDSVFDTVPGFETDHTEAMLKEDYCRISLATVNPELMKDIDKDRIKRAQAASVKARERIFSYYDTGRIKWTVAACPTAAWAASLFPDMPPEEALETLWQKVLDAARITGGDAVGQWKKHNDRLKRHEKWLNDQRFEKLRYVAPGTDLTVRLADNHVWVGGASQTPSGVWYMANMPTEEIFTAPHMLGVDGVLTATKPLCLMGSIIEGMRFTFKDGKVVAFSADKNGEIFENMLNMDEGARRLGEVAIVPFASPINQTGILFKETLFDENASCHFAVGNSYAETVRGGESMTEEERKKLGANKSSIHIDFMVGSDKLNITGLTFDGREVPVLINGEWAD